MSDLIPVDNSGAMVCVTHEERIVLHATERAIADQPIPDYVISDHAFMRIVYHRRFAIRHRKMAGVRMACLDIEYGSTGIRVYAGGLKQPDDCIETVERAKRPR